MIRNLRSRRRPRYGAQVCAVLSALLLLFSVSILYTRLSLSSKPDMYPRHSYVDDSNNDAVFPTIPLLSDSEDVTAATITSSTDDKLTNWTPSKKTKRAFNKRSIQDWDYDGGFLNDGFGGDDDKIKEAFGSDDIPLDEEIRRKMTELESIEDALLVKKVTGRKVNPLREKWGDWFDKKSDFLRRDRMFKSNLEILNPLNNPLLQDPDGVGMTGLTRGDKMVQKWILSEFKKVPFTVKKPLGIFEMGLEVKKDSASKKNENTRNVLSVRGSSRGGKDDSSSITNGNVSRIRKNKVNNADLEAHKSNAEFTGGIYADGKRWGYYPGLDSRLSFTNFVDAFFKKGKCDIIIFMIWNSPPWMYSVRHQRGLESLLAQHPDACVLVEDTSFFI
ncbi:Alpha 1,4-glycosyltransferase family protein, putative isoform 2 [Hibiscus syriacus]|uniref:Alpha 1,4-glycosyltransferase family protein, putative isoform 2 n=1 Tax=Hibiscus syriacus TaxID=106335 RepID=A0A6A2XAI4_HIBSY|nr:Alpha 1,4-glycosyltransferase family protein, putative isoform 2 [Hibiscus syriacus]